MAMSWYLDEGLVALRTEWRREHPRAVVYTIADGQHSTDPGVSQHAPDRGGSAPGDDLGEVDAADFMPGNGVTEQDLAELFDGLIRSRDPRILYVIHRNVIVSSVVSPWTRRTYRGTFHSHVHVSVNDRFDDNASDWRWEALVARELKMVDVETKLPELLMLGDDDDMWGGYNHVGRAQALANWLDSNTEPVETDGVYGPKSAAKFARALKTSGTLARLTLGQLKQLHGLS